MFAGKGADRQVECATGNKRNYGFGSDCAVLWGNYESIWPLWDITCMLWKWYWKVHRLQTQTRYLETLTVWWSVMQNVLLFLFQILK